MRFGEQNATGEPFSRNIISLKREPYCAAKRDRAGLNVIRDFVEKDEIMPGKRRIFQ